MNKLVVLGVVGVTAFLLLKKNTQGAVITITPPTPELLQAVKNKTGGTIMTDKNGNSKISF